MGLLAAKGTTFTFAAGQVLKVKSVKASKDDNSIDVTGLEDSEHVVTGGTPKREITISIFGKGSIATGDTGTITILWGGTTSDTLGGFTYRCCKAENSVDVDGAQVTDYTFMRDAG
jgi:hypothetical protein